MPRSRTEEKEEKYRIIAKAVLEGLQEIKPVRAGDGPPYALTSLLQLYAYGPSSDTEARAPEEDDEAAADDEDTDELRFDFDFLEFLSFILSSPDLQPSTGEEMEGPVRGLLNWAAAQATVIKQERIHSATHEKSRTGRNITVAEAQVSTPGLASSSEGRTGIFDLPPEILVLIIEHLRRDDLSFPWKFSHVSRACRDIALGTPTLWSTIDFEIGIRRVQAQLKRSKSAPLTVSARLFDQDRLTLSMLGGILLCHADRLRRLQVIFTSFHAEELGSAMISWLAGEFPVLEALDIGFGSIFSPVPGNLRITKGSDPVVAPVLEHLTLRSCAMNEQCLLIPVGNLRSLTLVDVQTTMFSLAQVLQSAQELESLRIEVFDQRTVPDLPLEVDISLPKLRNAEFIYIGETSCLRSSIQAPAVQRLVYHPKATNSLWDQRRWLSQTSLDVLPEPNMPLPNLQAIRSLILIDCPMVTEGWSILFHSLPNLEDLCLSGCGLSGTYLSSLSGLGGNTVLACPLLTCLRIEEDFTLGTAAVLGIVMSRVAKGSSSIRRVELRKWLASHVEDADIEAIAELIDEIVVDAVDDKYSTDDEDEDEDEVRSAASDTSKDSWYYEYDYESSDREFGGSAAEEPNA